MTSSRLLSHLHTLIKPPLLFPYTIRAMASFLYIEDQPNDSRCVVTSHGWSILVEQETTLYLLSPKMGARIQLPSSGLNPNLVTKAILSADPAKNSDFAVIVIYGYESNVALLGMASGNTEWSHLNHMTLISDIVCHNNKLLLALDAQGYVVAWDFCRAMTVDHIKPSFPWTFYQAWGAPMRDLCSSRWYLVQSWLDLFLVSRVVGEFVGEDGVPVCEADLLDGKTNHPLVCPYRTLKFEVYRHNSSKNEWEEVEGIGDHRALFLGGNHSISVSRMDFPECQGNSIYFTDDYWERMDEDYLYGGHDVGVYSMAEKSVKEIVKCDSDKIEPPPFWALPSSCY